MAFDKLRHLLTVVEPVETTILSKFLNRAVSGDGTSKNSKTLKNQNSNPFIDSSNDALFASLIGSADGDSNVSGLMYVPFLQSLKSR